MSYVGEVGTRMNLFLKVARKHYMATHDAYIYSFVDRGGNNFSAFIDTQKNEKFGLEVGDCIDLDAYINSHAYNDYQKVEETRLNRIKLIENVTRKMQESEEA